MGLPRFTGEVTGEPAGGVSGETAKVEQTLGLRGGWPCGPEGEALGVAGTGCELERVEQSTLSVGVEELPPRPAGAPPRLDWSWPCTSPIDSGHCDSDLTCLS